MPIIKSQRQITNFDSGRVPASQVGNNVSAIAGQAADIYRDTVSRSMMIDKMADWREILRTKRLQLKQKKSGDALDIYNEGSKWIQDEYARFEQNLHPFIKSQFNQAASSLNDSFLDNIATYQASQAEQYKIDSLNKGIDSWANESYDNPYDDEVYNLNKEKALTVIDKNFGGNPGMKDKAIAALENARMDSLLKQDTIEELIIAEKKFNDIKGSFKNRDLVQKYEDAFKSRKNALEREKEVSEKEAKSKIKAQKKIDHDTEERNLGDLFVRENYTEALKLINESGLLTGPEKKEWFNAINSNLDKAEKEVGATKEAEEIVKINSMISGQDDPNSIRKYIVQNTNIKKEDKEQYLNKLESEISSEVKAGRSAGYSEIKTVIDPSYDNRIIPPTSIIPQRISQAQFALDEFIDDAKSNNKFLSRSDIKKKAREIAQDYQLTLIEKYEENYKQLNETIKAVEFSNLTVKDIPKADKERIEKSLTASGQIITDDRVLQIYKLNHVPE
jgi:hypothetical protein